MSSDVATGTGDLIVAREGAAGVIRLNRPKALNALTLEMTREIATALDVFEKDPQGRADYSRRCRRTRIVRRRRYPRPL
jgi:hypothetical protein